MRVALFLNLIDPKWTALSMERYGVELKKNLDKLTDQDTDIVSFQPSIPKALTYLPTRWRYQLSRFYYYPFYAQRHEGNVNHIIDHSFAQVAQFLNKNKTIVTCHDLIPLKYLPDGTRVEKDPFALDLFQKSVAHLTEVGMVIVDSQETKKDLISILGVKEEKIKVVYLGRNEAFKQTPESGEVREKLQLGSRKILLHVGHNLAYKNMQKILASLRILKDKKVPFIFVKIGPEFNKEQRDLVSQYNLEEDIVALGFLSEKDLISLYNASDLLVYPSIFEGFGLPVLEAMSCGLPVVVSKNTSLKEIVGDVLDGVNSNSEEEIAAEIIRILSLKREEVKKLKENLKERSERFSWENTARETLAIYKEIYED